MAWERKWGRDAKGKQESWRRVEDSKGHTRRFWVNGNSRFEVTTSKAPAAEKSNVDITNYWHVCLSSFFSSHSFFFFYLPHHQFSLFSVLICLGWDIWRSVACWRWPKAITLYRMVLLKTICLTNLQLSTQSCTVYNSFHKLASFLLSMYFKVATYRHASCKLPIAHCHLSIIQLSIINAFLVDKIHFSLLILFF